MYSSWFLFPLLIFSCPEVLFYCMGTFPNIYYIYYKEFIDGNIVWFYFPTHRPAGGEHKAQTELLETLLKRMNVSVVMLYVHIAVFYETDNFAIALQFILINNCAFIKFAFSWTGLPAHKHTAKNNHIIFKSGSILLFLCCLIGLSQQKS